MQIVNRSVVYDAAQFGESGRIAFFDSLLRLESGSWLSGFTTGQTKHHHQGTIRVSRSTDGAKSWSVLPWQFATKLDGVPGSLAGAETVEIEPGRLLLFSTWFDRSDPDRPLFDPETEGILRSRQLMAVSLDDGETWSDWSVISTDELTGCAITGPVVKWPDGTLAFAFESFKEFDDPAPARHGAWLLLSGDGGRTFDRRFLVGRDPKHEVYYWDQRICPGAADGDFVALFWTHDRAEKRDLRVHFLRSSLTDGEQAASTPVETSIPGQIAAPLMLADGRILAFVVNRERPGTMRLWQSLDGGKTWPESSSLLVHEHNEQALVTQSGSDIDFAEYWEDMGKWSFGHPSIRLASDQEVLVTWYAGTPDCMNVHAALIDVSS